MELCYLTEDLVLVDCNYLLNDIVDTYMNSNIITSDIYIIVTVSKSLLVQKPI